MNMLELWIHSVIKKLFAEDQAFRNYLDKTSLEKVSKEDVQKYKMFKLRKMLNYVYEKSPYFKKHFDEQNIKPGDIKTFEDMVKIPLTEPEDLAENPNNFLCVPQGEILRGFTTSGTSGRVKRTLYTMDDLLRIGESIIAGFKMVGMTGGDSVQITFPIVAEWDPWFLLEKAVQLAGAKPILAGMLSVEEQLKKLKESKATMIIGIASYIHRLTRVAKKAVDLKNFGIKGIILSAEPWPEAAREEIQEAWECKAYSQYGTVEMGLAVSLECDARDGLHLNDADFFVECIDSETGEQLKLGEGGELVFTTLSRRGMPLIRYRSYDISWLIDETCGCGASTIQKMGKVKGRLDMQHKIGYGKKIYPLLFDEGLVKIPNIINWQVVIEEEEAKDKITIKVEATETPSEEELKNKIVEELMKIEEITESLAKAAITEPKIEILKPGTLKTTHKSKSIIDARKTYE